MHEIPQLEAFIYRSRRVNSLTDDPVQGLHSSDSFELQLLHKSEKITDALFKPKHADILAPFVYLVSKLCNLYSQTDCLLITAPGEYSNQNLGVNSAALASSTRSCISHFRFQFSMPSWLCTQPQAGGFLCLICFLPFFFFFLSRLLFVSNTGRCVRRVNWDIFRKQRNVDYSEIIRLLNHTKFKKRKKKKKPFTGMPETNALEAQNKTSV